MQNGHYITFYIYPLISYIIEFNDDSNSARIPDSTYEHLHTITPPHLITTPPRQLTTPTRIRTESPHLLNTPIPPLITPPLNAALTTTFNGDDHRLVETLSESSETASLTSLTTVAELSADDDRLHNVLTSSQPVVKAPQHLRAPVNHVTYVFS